MGKALVLASITFIVLGTYYGTQRQASELETRRSVSDSQYETIARNGALAGLNMARQSLSECFLPKRFKGTSGGATYQVETKIAGDIANVTSMGSIMGAEDRDVNYTVTTQFQRWTKDVPFDIVNDKTVPKVSYNLETRVLGSEISYGGAYEMPVTLRIEIGGQTFEPFGDFEDGGSAVSSSSIFEPDESFAADAAISMTARSWFKSGRGWSTYMEQGSDTGGDNLVVLRDGDHVPSVAGMGGQVSVGEILGPYTQGGKIKLNENQSIYLFELGSSNPASSAFDLQDLVVLIDLSPAGGDVTYTEEESSTETTTSSGGRGLSGSQGKGTPPCGGYELRLRSYYES